MLQNRVISPTLTTPVSTELADSLERTLANERLQVVKRTFSLPDSLSSFLGFLLILLFICGALIAHVWLSTSLHKSELRLIELKTINLEIEQENTILIQQIAESSSLTKGIERVQQAGYEPAYEYRFIVQNSSEFATSALTQPDDLTEQPQPER